MIITSTVLAGLFIFEMNLNVDSRGEFGRLWCQREMSDSGINTTFVQSNISRNRNRGTVRGMHYQADPYAEAKLVTCIRGSIYDVVFDLRPDSSTFQRSFVIELSANSNRSLFVPKGFAHGFQTLEEDTQVLYHMDQFYNPDSARGIRYDDPTFNIDWPITTGITISDNDLSYRRFEYLKEDYSMGRLV